MKMPGRDVLVVIYCNHTFLGALSRRLHKNSPGYCPSGSAQCVEGIKEKPRRGRLMCAD